MQSRATMPSEIAPGPIALFYSYSRKDAGLRNELSKHLTTLERAGFIREWHDRQILGGEEWDRHVSIHLESADVILLLISADFLASKYCYDIEAKRALQRHSAGIARVIPIILRPVVWKHTPFAALQALPSDARAVTEWPDLDRAFVNICEGLLATVVAWKDSHTRSSAGNEMDRYTSRKAARARKGVLDAALPSHVPTGKATILVVMLRREDSSGLRLIVEMEETYGVEKKDVSSTPSFRLQFPVDPSGKLVPLDLVLVVHAPDFEPQTQRKNVSVPPEGDSEPKVLLLTPQREGELVLTVQLLEGDREITSCLLRTNAAASEHEISARHRSFISIPLSLGLVGDEAMVAGVSGVISNAELKSLRDLVCLCAGPRDDHAWEEFVSRFGKPIGLTIIRIALLWGERSPSVVEDLVQNTYTKLWEDGCRLLRDSAIQHPEAILGYIKKTAANTAHDYFRHLHSESSGGDKPHVSISDVDPEAGQKVHGSPERIAFEVFLNEIDEHLKHSLTGPDRERDRMIFWLHFRQGMTTKEIASLPTVELSAKGVGSVIERVKHCLREQILRLRADSEDDKQ